MDFTVIDLARWPRRTYFQHYLKAVPCTYSVTTKLDITPVRRRGLKLYPTMLYLITCAVNQCEPFRMALREDGSLVRYASMSPCYTVFHRESETFSNLWTEYTPDYAAFCRQYDGDLARYGAVEGFWGKPDPPENTFNVSMVPWISFDSFNLNVGRFDYLLPIFTLGRCQEVGGQALIPLSIQVHHAVCDGYHVSRFLSVLQDAVQRL